MSVIHELKSIFQALPFQTALLNKKTALLVKDLYKRLADEAIYEPSQTFFYTYVGKLDKYLVYYDIGSTVPHEEGAVFSSEISEQVHHSLMLLNGILAKHTALNGEETVGMELLRQAMEFRYEKFDGTGGPGRFEGAQIPPVALMLPVCEMIANAMLSGEPLSAVRTRLERGAGKEFDPHMVQLACELAEQWYEKEQAFLMRYHNEATPAVEMQYQPVMDCRKHKVWHYAGRLVINDPKQGAIQPEVYTQVAEKNGRMAQLTQIGLEQLCERLALEKFQAKPQMCPLTIHLSYSCLRKKSFLAMIQKTVERYQVNPANILFEVTETALAYEDSVTKEALRHLKSMGFGVVLSRFGAEYASLAKLNEWEFSCIKLDPVFAETVAEDHKTYEIVKSILGLAESLEMDVIVAGVDHYKQQEMLLQLGCRYMQGDSIRFED